MMDEAATDAEREVWESVNDLIVERAEVVMYRAGIQALELLGMDGKMIGALKKNLKEEEAFARWLEVNNPRIAKKLMGEQIRKGKKKKRMAELAGTTSIQEEEQRAEAATTFAA